MNSKAFQKVLIFDSGIGGFSIVKEISNLGLNIEINYLADTLFFPYGDKSDLDLLKRLPNLLKNAVEYIKPDFLIIACNTASTIALGQIRQIIDIPVIGVVPAIKPAAQISSSKYIGLLATPRTVGSSYTESLIEQFASDCHILRYGAPLLAKAAEEYICTNNENIAAIDDAIDGIMRQQNSDKIDTIILACTHYPLVLALLQKRINKQINWIDSGQAIAKRLYSLMENPKNHQNTLFGTAYHTGGSHVIENNYGFITAAKKFGFANILQLGKFE